MELEPQHKHPAPAKITRPRLPKVLARERLFRLMDNSHPYPLVWVMGPPGAGKTTLVASYLDARKLHCIWYQIDEGDADPASFFYFLGLATKKAAPRCKRPLSLFTPEYTLGIHAFAKRYFESLFERLKQPFLLVLDNYQIAQPNSLLHDILVDGLGVVPQGMQVVVISRSEPPAAFARFQANSQMMIVNGEHLRLTNEELLEIMLLQGARDTSQEMVRLFSQKTSGWAAGAVLLCRAAKLGISDLEMLTTPLSDKVIDYFSNEVFERTEAETRDFLLKTAFMVYLTPKIAKELSGHVDADGILSALHRRNFFVEMRPDPELTYQYHPLFREFLLSRARKSFTPDALSRVQCHSARLLAQNSHIENAVALYHEAGEWEGLVDLILKHAPALMRQGRNRTITGWFSTLPTDMTEKDPWLLYWRGMSAMPFDPVASNADLERAFSLFTKKADRAGTLLAWSGVVDSILLQFDRFGRFDHWFKVLQQILKANKDFPSQEIESRVALSMFSAINTRKPHHPDAFKWRERMLSLADRSGDVNFQMIAANHASWHELCIGNPAKSALFIRPFEKIMRQNQSTPLNRVMIMMLSSIHCWLQGRNEECQTIVSEALRTANESGVHVWDFQILGNATLSALSCGDAERSEELLQRMEEGLPRLAALGKSLYYYLAAWHALTRNDHNAAREYANKGIEYVEHSGSIFSIIIHYAGIAVLHHEMKNYDESERQLKRARHIAQKMNSPALLFVSNLAAAQIAFDRGKELEGRKTLSMAMTIGREQDYMNMYGWRPDVMARLCVKALEIGIEPEYVKKVIRRRNLVPENPPLDVDSWPWPIKIYTLGRFTIVENGELHRFSGKSQKKPLDMLKAMISLGGRDISEQKITDALWPDTMCDYGSSLFKTTLHRLRQLMKNNCAIVVQEGRLTLDNGQCWVDVWTFERLIGKAEKMWPQEWERKGVNKAADRHKEAARLTEKAVSLYKGNFLETDCNEPWTISLREHLRMSYVRAIGRLGAFWEQAGELEKAADCYQSGLKVDHLTEEFYQDLMSCYRKMGRKSEAIKTYQRCSSVLKANLGIEPSPETTALYHALMH
jgi:LuxR family maltose regulon positive regulatory protein